MMMTEPHDLTATELLAGLPDAGEQAHRRLRDRLAAAADAAGILDVAYRTVDSPVGSLLLAATGEGLVRVAYASEGHDAVLDRLAARVSPRAVRAAGTACATNPLPVVMPCHRVVRSDGILGSYVGGPSVKQALLTLEGAFPAAIPAMSHRPRHHTGDVTSTGLEPESGVGSEPGSGPGSEL